MGFHARASDTVVAVPDCKLITPAIRAALPALEALTLLSCSRKGEVALTVTEAMGGVDILINTDKPLTSELRIALAQAAQSHGLSRLVWND